tara:strand:+ start:1744 stop:1920 length:177 start_codon:yes stop_codon:yes gene_type:complete
MSIYVALVLIVIQQGLGVAFEPSNIMVSILIGAITGFSVAVIFFLVNELWLSLKGKDF